MLTLEINNILLLALYNPEIVGFYSLASRTLNLPLQLIGRAVGQVFYKDAIAEKQQSGKASQSFKRSVLLLSAVALLIAVVIGFFAPQLYSIVFGKRWLLSGEMAQILMFMFATRLVSSSVSDVLNVYGKQKTALIINFILFGNILLCYTLAEIFSFGIERYLTIYSINSGILYLIFLLHYRKIVTSS
jgi:O-antigen/teichoic acid export membrane protein